MFKQLPDDAGDKVRVFLNGEAIDVAKGISAAAVALSHNLPFTRTTPVSGSKRAPFCMMGVCYECLMVIDGKPNSRACATYVEEGMRIDTQFGAGPSWGDILDE